MIEVIDSAPRTILIVEDNPGALKLFRLTLEAEGYRVFVATDARSALAQFAREPVGLALIDFRLPDMHGTELLRRLRAMPQGADLPVVAVSGFKTQLEQLHCGPESFTAALLKPVQPSTLVETVRELLPLEQPKRQPSTNTRTILVVDDDPVQLKLTRLRLEHEGYRVVVAPESEQALALAISAMPDAVLCDVLMPQTDGYELCSLLRSCAELAHVPVILISAYYGAEGDEALARSVGALALVTRTPDLAEALTVLRGALVASTSPSEPPPVLVEQEHNERVLAQLEHQVRTNSRFAEKSELQAAQLSILAGISEALLRSDEVPAALDDVLTTCLDACGVTRGAQYKISPDQRLVLTHSIGFSEAAAATVEEAFGCSSQLSSAPDDAVVSVRRCLSQGELSRLFALTELSEAILIPLREEQRLIGALLLGSDSAELAEQDLLSFGRAIAGQIAQALALAESFSRLREGEEAGRALAVSLDLEQTLSCVGRLATARLADVCEIRLIDAPARIYVRTGTMCHEADALQRPGHGQRIVCKLKAHGAILGTLTFVRSEQRRKLSSADEHAAEDLAGRASIAINNAILYRAANEASRMKDEFLATVSHELRTPLNAIMGWAHVLMSGTVQHKHEQACRVIHRNALAQARLIDDMLDTSRITSGKVSLELRPIAVERVIDAAAESAKPALENKRMELRRTGLSASSLVLGDASRLQQVIWNLLSNALKFTPSGGRIEIDLSETDTHVVLTVTDNGEGISPTFLASVFDRFKQADGSRTRTHGGLGLGLAITRHLVELHGGKISARSGGKGQGASFVVELPMAVDQTSDVFPTHQTGTAPLIAPRRISNIAVLVVDDDDDTRELLLSKLEDLGFRVMGAASAAEALASVATSKPDILLSDIGMPGEDGYALIRRLRALPREQGGTIPAAAITAYARDEDRALALAAGFQLHVAKPLDVNALVATVNTLQELCSESVRQTP